MAFGITLLPLFLLLWKDGRLCAAAFVQNRKSYTGCTDAPNPAGESGRSWCYVEAQVSNSSLSLAHRKPVPPALLFHVLFRHFVEVLNPDSATEAAWDYCAPVVDYDVMRKEISHISADKAFEVQGLVARLEKTQRAAEQALDRRVLLF